MAKLNGKVAVITGGTRGTGLAAARLFAAHGASVVITGRRQHDLDAAVRNIGNDTHGIQNDISKLADLSRLYDRLHAKYGRIDVLFANAGVGTVGLIGDVSDQQFDRTFDVNVKGTFFTVQKLLPLMSDGGSIILNASIAGSTGMEALSVYSATKAAIRSFARTWTTELKDRKIRVNAISPGLINAPIFEQVGADEEQRDGFREILRESIPLGRIGHVDDIAKAALFLASADSSFITGIELTVDGGMSQTYGRSD